MPQVPSLSVVLPAFNERENIGPLVEQALQVGPRLAQDFEVIVVDDGSSDATGEATARLVEQHYPQVRLVTHQENLGYGAAIRTGFEHARSSLVFYTDSDRQFDLAELEYFLPMIAEHDLVIGFRVYRYDSFLRSLISWAYNRLVRVLFRVRVRDVDCAFKLFRHEVLDKITVECENFFVDTELVAKARKWNFRIAEKGVRHYPRQAGETTVRASDVKRTLREIVRMWQSVYLPGRSGQNAAATRDRSLEAIEMIPAGRPAVGRG